ncbi:hypothetical protein B5P44_00225 [Mycobacterium sp. CBMA 213]|uniref:Uncharacterized protein n=1 Tax=Mycolicibacterium sp. CBMA 213 TaxID=1968788 RepID=A0A343VR23_9MYCO|nr:MULTISPECIES: hypothetical protein [unclassified Mycolicibacterium]AVN58347.1 hypothetical protein B5P44_p00052 [Mycolicibacterium sp. CBMA 213]MUL61011.1 hypothetical protein [Mycolicibacterium sp. CBMA 335]MUM03248.1 hypothetical protein [Mycolicibacterium sp. CBMA 213]
MSDTVLYNAGIIEGALTQIHGLNQKGQDIAQGMVGQTRRLDDISSGQSTNAFNDFSASDQQLRSQTSEITQMIHRAVQSSHEDQTGVDSQFAGIISG